MLEPSTLPASCGFFAAGLINRKRAFVSGASGDNGF
jgi:hypothetical protein